MKEMETCSACGEEDASTEYLTCAKCADEHDAVVATQARRKALEEAASICDELEAEYDKPEVKWNVSGGASAGRSAQRIRALITTQAPASSSVETARSALEGVAYVKTRNALGARDNETLQDAAARVARETVPLEKVRETLARNRRFALLHNQPLVRAAVADIAADLGVEFDGQDAQPSTAKQPTEPT